MALVKHRVYTSVGVEPIPAPSVVTDWGFTPLQHHTPTATGLATLLRTRAEMTATISVGAPGLSIPPEQWWAECDAFLAAWWVPSGSLSILPGNGHDERYLGSQLMQKRLIASPSAPTEYYVQYYTDEPLVTETARKPVVANIASTVNWVMYFRDPLFALSGGYSAMNTHAYIRGFSLWGDTI